MPIWLHHITRIVSPSIFFIAGLIIFVLFIQTPLLGFLFAAAGFFVIGFAAYLFVLRIPIACPQCNDRAYAKKLPEGRLYFECVRCGYIHEARLFL